MENGIFSVKNNGLTQEVFSCTGVIRMPFSSRALSIVNTASDVTMQEKPKLLGRCDDQTKRNLLWVSLEFLTEMAFRVEDKWFRINLEVMNRRDTKDNQYQ